MSRTPFPQPAICPALVPLALSIWWAAEGVKWVLVIQKTYLQLLFPRVRW